MSGQNRQEITNAPDAAGVERNSICPRCDDAFGCGAKAGLARCWCMELPALAAPDFNASCYCPRCLREILKERAG